MMFAAPSGSHRSSFLPYSSLLPPKQSTTSEEEKRKKIQTQKAWRDFRKRERERERAKEEKGMKR